MNHTINMYSNIVMIYLVFIATCYLIGLNEGKLKCLFALMGTVIKINTIFKAHALIEDSYIN